MAYLRLTDPRTMHATGTRFGALILMLLTTLNGQLLAGGLVRVSDDARSYEGKVVGLTRSTCSLIDREGRLLRLPVASLRKFEKLAPTFEPYSARELRDRLREEFSGYEVSGRGAYLVCGPPGRSARYAELFDSIYRDLDQFFRVRGFNVQKPTGSLTAIVFRSQAEFFAYARKDGVKPDPGLQGYYSLNTNRVALYDSQQLLSSARSIQKNPQVAALARIAGNTANTIIHEATHQVGYNIGIHSRIAGAPVWVVEGLATVLEPEGMRSRRSRDEKLNSERFNWFQKRHRPSRQPGDLAKLIASDDFFSSQTLDSYSESWALTYFLLDNSTRQRQFVSYLKRIGDRDPAKKYTARERLSDFQAEFGDISRLEVDFLRFMERM